MMMKPRKPGEDAETYIKRLEASNAELRKLGKYAEKVSRAVTHLALEGSVAFQAMAEKAGVRSHPSVTEAVKLFDAIAHPQWTPDDAEFNGIAFPESWDFVDHNQWSGDADMQLNQPIADVIGYLESRKFQVKIDEWQHITQLMAALDKPIHGWIEGKLPERKRPPLEIPEDATRDDLISALHDMTWAALDLAQDMGWTNECLRRDLRAAAYRRIHADLCKLASCDIPRHSPEFDLKIMGGDLPF